MRFSSRQTSPALVSLCVVLGLSACSSTPTSPPVTDINDQAPIERTPPPTARPAPDTTGATTALLASAKTARASRDPASAIAYLERAIRLSPRDPDLWINLSAAHLDDQNLAAAEQHARKAIALSSAEPSLERQAWLQYADVLDAQGKTSEANGIRRRYRIVKG